MVVLEFETRPEKRLLADLCMCLMRLDLQSELQERVRL